MTEALAAERELGAVPLPVNEVPAMALAETDASRAEAADLPSSARVALSLGRFVQDPLQEALRWDVTRIPLGPNQRDIDQGELRRRLEEVAEACVAAVGAAGNKASAALLARVPGLDANAAQAIVAWREKNGPFATRTDVKHVEGLSEASWQRAAGFLRVRGGMDPIDGTGVHPTGAHVVPAIAAKLGCTPQDLIGRTDLPSVVDANEFAGPVFTVSDVASVVEELAHGGADPRRTFAAPAFNPGVRTLRDLAAGQELDGVVTNLSKFGAFVDLGVRQEGLVHVSELAHHFVTEPGEVVSVGQTVRVKVVGVDPAKRRISLSIKALLPPPERPAPQPEQDRGPPRERRPGAPEGPSRGQERRGPPGPWGCVIHI